MKLYFTYIVTNKKRGTLYTGVTNDIMSRTLDHKRGAKGSFTGKYKLGRLVWFESFCTPSEAIRREKEIKGWIRCKKIELIEKKNPAWNDLCNELINEMTRKYQPMSKFWHYKR